MSKENLYLFYKKKNSHNGLFNSFFRINNGLGIGVVAVFSTEVQ